MRLFALAAGVCIPVMLLAGCNTRQPGLTKAEVARRHDRMYRLNSEMMMSDIDKTLMLDKPSNLTDKRIP